jgi:hypothetical protein
MGNGVVIPSAASTATSAAGTPRSPKVTDGTVAGATTGAAWVAATVVGAAERATMGVVRGRDPAMKSPNVEGSSCPAQTVAVAARGGRHPAGAVNAQRGFSGKPRVARTG